MSRSAEQGPVVPRPAGKPYLAETLYFGDDCYVVCYVSADQKTVQIGFGIEKNGLTKSEVKALIGALRKIREVMVR